MREAPHRAFAELRSLLDHRELDEAQRDRLWEMLRGAHAQDPRHYQREWIGYLEGFPHHFEAPLARLDGLDALLEAIRIAPLARFRLELSRVRLAELGAHELSERPELDAVAELICGWGAMTSARGRAGAGRSGPHLHSLPPKTSWTRSSSAPAWPAWPWPRRCSRRACPPPR